MAEDTRYPYTYACDFIRSIAGYGPGGTKLSRADASKIRSSFSSILKLPDEEVAKKLADYYLAHKEEIGEREAKSRQNQRVGEVCHPMSVERKLDRARYLIKQVKV